MRTLLLAAPLCLFSSLGMAKDHHRHGNSFLPKNDLHLQDHLFWNNSTIDEKLFGEIIDNAAKYYEPIIKAHGAELYIDKGWDDSTVNASAQQMGDKWQVNMYGGLARRPEVTPDGFALVVCHELGHHLAGFAFYGDSDWAASEGQSDYFATQSCSRVIWQDDKEENAKFAQTVHPTAKKKCDESWSNTDDRNLCYRTAMAGKSLADLLSALGGSTVDFDKPDTKVVRRTSTAHPEGQCRLDTYFAGSLCTADFDPAVIPAKDHDDGQTSKAAEREAAKYSCMTSSNFSVGLRPRCWFAPQLSLAFDKEKVETAEVKGNDNGAWEPGETFGVNLPLVNDLGTNVTGASLKLVAASNEVSVEGVADYPEIPAGESKLANQAVNVTPAANLECGAKFKVDAEVTAQNGMSVKDNLEFMLGKIAVAGSESDNESHTIPDNDNSGYEAKHAFTADAKVIQANLTVDISHKFPSDLTIEMVSPAGKKYKFPIAGTSSGAIKGTFTVELADENAKGEWTVVFRDSVYMDEGTLNSYTLELNGAECEGANNVVTLLK